MRETVEFKADLWSVVYWSPGVVSISPATRKKSKYRPFFWHTHTPTHTVKGRRGCTGAKDSSGAFSLHSLRERERREYSKRDRGNNGNRSKELPPSRLVSWSIQPWPTACITMLSFLHQGKIQKFILSFFFLVIFCYIFAFKWANELWSEFTLLVEEREIEKTKGHRQRELRIYSFQGGGGLLSFGIQEVRRLDSFLLNSSPPRVARNNCPQLYIRLNTGNTQL